MFEVDWTDYESVSVGDHKKRKETEREAKKKEDARSGRTSISTGSVSSTEKATGFFGSISLRKGSNTPAKSKKPVLPNLQINKDHDDKSKRDSLILPHIPTTSTLPFTISSMTSDDKNMSCSVGDGGYSFSRMGASSSGSPNRSSRESVLSKVTEITIPTPASPNCDLAANHTTTLVQSLGPDSRITRTTKTTSEPRTPTNDIGDKKSNVIIYANPSEPHTPASPGLPLIPVSPTSLVPSQRDVLPFLPNYDGASNTKPPLPLPNIHQPVPSASPTRAVRQKNTTGTASAWPTKLRVDDPDSWKAPNDWSRSPAGDKTFATTERLRQADEKEDTKASVGAMNLAAIQQEVKKMEAASYKIMLVRLTEEWGTAPEASFYQELEMEKKRWVLSALYRLGGQPGDEIRKGRIEIPKTQNILALFESKATTSWLAARHPQASIIHLSPLPLSNDLFPNVLPVYSPVMPRTSVPLSRGSFTSIHCLSMPSLIAGKDIPQLLQNVNGWLGPKGVLHLFLIDPEPAGLTVGPKMRAWLDENLMLNVGDKFRCPNPSKLFPKWLGEARLRGGGSLISKGKFWAAGKPNLSEASGSQDGIDDESSAKNELRNIMGRMLWQEVWGAFVNGTSWWWQDQECLDECHRLGTYWEYCVIEAVKVDDL